MGLPEALFLPASLLDEALVIPFCAFSKIFLRLASLRRLQALLGRDAVEQPLEAAPRLASLRQDAEEPKELPEAALCGRGPKLVPKTPKPLLSLLAATLAALLVALLAQLPGRLLLAAEGAALREEAALCGREGIFRA
eukprot:gb/GFBE01013661.1/.p1 GENE.gb/GFBE01013661.1/~~gb/GFBE01013661.1/.p1  ORF type:complete len:138 (+),score=35.08 gb/GFBE01013661.1/:1-414(+)